MLIDFVNNNPERIQVVKLPQNRGKAEAVREGILTLFHTYDFKLVGYWDADLATPL